MRRFSQGWRRQPPPLRRSEWRLFAGLAALCVLAIAQAIAPLQGAGAAANPSPAPLVTPARVHVIDGDTVEDNRSGERFRLANVDTAEISEPHCSAERRHGMAAKRRVEALIAGADELRLRRTGRRDSYGRTVAFILLDGRDLGRTLIAEGLARPWRGHREPWCGRGGELLR